MATSGSKTITVAYDTNGDVAVRLKFNWEVEEQDSSSLTSTVKCKLSQIAGDYGAIYSSTAKSYTITVNGTSYTGTASVACDNNETLTLWSKTIDIKHSSDGTKTFSYSFSLAYNIDFNGTIDTVSGSSSGTLPTITSSSGHSSVTVIRGRTVKYTDSSGTGTISDERIKDSWKDLDEYDMFFDTINPQAFKYTYGAAQGRYHLGFSAQSIEKALAESGLSNMDFAGIVKYKADPEAEDYNGYEEEYGLIYTEFVGLLTDQMQKVKKRTATLEEQSVIIDNKLSALEERLRLKGE